MIRVGGRSRKQEVPGVAESGILSGETSCMIEATWQPVDGHDDHHMVEILIGRARVTMPSRQFDAEFKLAHIEWFYADGPVYGYVGLTRVGPMGGTLDVVRERLRALAAEALGSEVRVVALQYPR